MINLPAHSNIVVVVDRLGLTVCAVELTHLVVKWSAVRNQSEIETSLKRRGMSLLFLSKWFSRDASLCIAVVSVLLQERPHPEVRIV